MLGVASAFALSIVPAAAQSQDSGVETVVVTGSRIASPDALSSAPISVVTSENITMSKTVTLEQILNKMPEMGQQGTNDQNSISPGGISTVDLRGLGPNRTLILIDGQRMVDTFVNGFQGQDLSNIPVSMIDRVEVLKDGSSPVYGADAIGGVVNVIMKKDFNGIQVDGGAGISNYGDHFTKQLGSTFGVSNDKASILVGMEYFSEDPVRQSERRWTQPDYAVAKGGDPYAVSYAIPQGLFYNSPPLDPPYAGANYLMGTPGGGLTGWDYNTFNTSTQPDLIQGRRVFNANVIVNYKVTNDVTLFAETFYTNRKSTALLNPEPVGTYYVTAKYLNGLSIPGTNPNNPTGADLIMFKRLFEVGDRIFDDNVNTYQERVGLKGDFRGWNWEIGYNYGESDGNDFEHNAVNMTHLQELVGNLPCEPSAPAGCGGVTLFGTNSLTADQADYIRYVSANTSRLRQQVGYADITGDLPISLPGGAIGAAFGVDWRDESVSAIPDSTSQAGDSAESNALPTSGNYNVKEVYGELKLPLITNKDFFQELSFDVAARYSDYSNFGGAGVYKGSVNWAITEDIRFRADYGTGFRAPKVGSELFLGNTASADGFTDPCEGATDATVIANCTTSFAASGAVYNPATFSQQLPQLNATWTGNSALRPETSNQYNVGVVLTPRFLPNFTFSADYYNIHVHDLITLLDEDTVLNDCYTSPTFTGQYCSYIAPRTATGQLVGFYNPYVNLGILTTDGIDFSSTYQTDLPDMDFAPGGWSLTLDAKATYLNSFNEDGTEYAGQWTTGAISTAYPKWKGYVTGTVSLLDSGLSVAWTERVVGATTNGGDAPVGDQIPALMFSDLVLSVPWGDHYTGTFGIDNLFDKDPPLASDPYVQSVSDQYDFVGRFFFIKLTAKY
jgi:outer membrane receptor protein involved in Fe transport